MAQARLTVMAALVVLGVVHTVRAAPPTENEASAPPDDADGASGGRSADPLSLAPREAAPQERARAPRDSAPKEQAPAPKEPSKLQQSPRMGGGEVRRGPSPGSKEAAVLAQRYFLQALESYRRGDYPAALADLHRASTLDPGSKDLEYNLALVHEKVGELQDAIEHWRRYQELETDADERERAELTILRLQAVHSRQLRTTRPLPDGARGRQGGQLDSGSARRKPGAFEDWAMGSTVVSAAALCVGAVLGVRALTTDPDRDSDIEHEKYAELEERAGRAHAYAIGADLAFAVGAGAGVAAGLFWFAGAEDGSSVATQSRGAHAGRGPGLRFSGEF